MNENQNNPSMPSNPVKPSSPLSSLTPSQTPEQPVTIWQAGKGIMIAAVIAMVLVSFGVYALFHYGTSSQYQGLIKTMEEQSAEIKNAQENLR